MVRGFVSSALVLSFLLLTTNLVPTSSSADSKFGDREFIDFDDVDGTHFVENLTLNGSMTFDGYNHSWSIVDLFDLDASDSPKLLLFGQYLDAIIPVEEGLWKWSLNVNLSGINCTCQIIISSTYDNELAENSVYMSSLIVYLGDLNHHPFIIQDSFSSEKIDGSNHSIVFTITTPPDAEGDVMSLTNEGYFLSSNYCQAPSNICLDNMLPVDLSYTLTGDTLSIFIDQEELLIDDGFWQFYFSIKDRFLRESNFVSSKIVLDITPPSVILTSQSDILESESFLVYAYVDDNYIGSQLSLTWTITDPSGDSRGLLEEESYHNSTIELVLDQSGDWDVQILVRDSANFLVIKNITISVENVIPVIDLNIDGFSISQGDELFVTDESSWLLNASTSFDSNNDMETLQFEWYFDGMKLDKSGPILFDNDIELVDTCEIKLVIYDDDLSSDNLSFTLSVNQISQDDSSSKVIIFIGSGFFAFILLIGLIIYARRDSTSIEVPKWKSKN